MVVHPRLVDGFGAEDPYVGGDDDVIPRVGGGRLAVFHNGSKNAVLTAVGVSEARVGKFLPIQVVHILGVGSNAVTVLLQLIVDEVFGIEVARDDAVFLRLRVFDNSVDLCGTTLLAAPIKVEGDNGDPFAANRDTAGEKPRMPIGGGAFGGIACCHGGIRDGRNVLKRVFGEKRLAVVGFCKDSFIVGQHVLVKRIIGIDLFGIEEKFRVLLQSPKVGVYLAEHLKVFLQGLLGSAAVFDMVFRAFGCRCKVANVKGSDTDARA